MDHDLAPTLWNAQNSPTAAGKVAVRFSVSPLVFLKLEEAAHLAPKAEIDRKLALPFGNIAGKNAEKGPEK